MLISTLIYLIFFTHNFVFPCKLPKIPTTTSHLQKAQENSHSLVFFTDSHNELISRVFVAKWRFCITRVAQLIKYPSAKRVDAGLKLPGRAITD